MADKAAAASGSSPASIQVITRFRPQNSIENAQNGRVVVSFEPDGKGVALTTSDNPTPYKFAFDRIFAPGCSQEEVYKAVGLPVVEDVFKGYNGTIFVYGQTGAGKSFTMMGPNTLMNGYCDDPKLKGIIPRCVESIFSEVENSDPNIEFLIKVSYIEIYQEKIRDLLCPDKQNLQIHEDRQSGRGVFIEDATESNVSCAEEVFELIQEGASNRVVASTKMNLESSRSHSILIVTLQQKDLVKLEQKSGKLYLVDLAGSEKVSKTGAEGQQLEEAKNINKSLTSLGMVINALTDGKSTHVPYRDSKLTRLLQDSLGGNSRTTLVINCSCSSYNEFETLSTLRFGQRAKAIKNKPRVNREMSVQELKVLLSRAEAEIQKQKLYIAELEQSGGKKASSGGEPVPDVRAVIEELQKVNEQLQSKVEELESKSVFDEDEKTKLKDFVAEVCQDLNDKKEELSMLAEKIAIMEHEALDSGQEKEILIAQLLDQESKADRFEYEAQEKALIADTLARSNEMLKADLQNLQSQVTQLQRQLEERQEISDLKKEDTQESSLLNKWDMEKRSRQMEAQEFTSRYNGYLSPEEDPKELLKKIGDLEKEKEDLRIELETLKSQPIAPAAAAAPQNTSGGPVTAPEVEQEPSCQLVTPPPQQQHQGDTNNGHHSDSTSATATFGNASLTADSPQTELWSEVQSLRDVLAGKVQDVEKMKQDFQWKVDKLEANHKNEIQFYTQRRQETATESKASEAQLQELQNKIIEAQREALRAREDKEKQRADFEVVKTALLRDLQNRCEKVIDLEMNLDEARDQYKQLLINSSDKALKKKLTFMERNLEQLTVSYQHMYNENSSLKLEIQLAEKKLAIRNDRILNLEKLLQDAQEKNKQMQEHHAGERTKMIQEMENHKAQLAQLHDTARSMATGDGAPRSAVRKVSSAGISASHRGNIVKPIRGGTKRHVGASGESSTHGGEHSFEGGAHQTELQYQQQQHEQEVVHSEHVTATQESTSADVPATTTGTEGSGSSAAASSALSPSHSSEDSYEGGGLNRTFSAVGLRSMPLPGSVTFALNSSSSSQPDEATPTTPTVLTPGRPQPGLFQTMRAAARPPVSPTSPPGLVVAPAAGTEGGWSSRSRRNSTRASLSTLSGFPSTGISLASNGIHTSSSSSSLDGDSSLLHHGPPRSPSLPGAPGTPPPAAVDRRKSRSEFPVSEDEYAPAKASPTTLSRSSGLLSKK